MIIHGPWIVLASPFFKMAGSHVRILLEVGHLLLMDNGCSTKATAFVEGDGSGKAIQGSNATKRDLTIVIK